MITYKVREFYTTFQADATPVTITTTFDSEDVFKTKELAEHFYISKYEGLNFGSFSGLPFASPDEFMEGKNSAASIDFSILVNGEEHCLSGDDDTMYGLCVEANELLKDPILLTKDESYDLFGVTTEGVKILLNGGKELMSSEIEVLQLWQCREKMLQLRYMGKDFLPTVL